VILQVEAVNAQARQQLHVIGERHLILAVHGRHVRSQMVVRVGRALTERHGR